jgi:hypothetical protein
MDTKNCIKCNKIFSRNKKYSISQWNTASFCSRSCSAITCLTGRKLSEEHKTRVSLANKGKRNTFTKEHIENIKKGVTQAIRVNAKIRMTGSSNPNWKNGATSEARRIRSTSEYREWRNKVFSRDNYMCIHCGLKFIKGVTGTIKFNADHIKPFATYKELRFDINNGRTLCHPCHTKTETYGRPKKQ